MPVVGLFRRSFEVKAIPCSLRISATADNRYVLWLNGTRLGRGPLKGTLEHYQVETYELGPLLRVGRNILAAEVRWAGEHTAASEVHSEWPGWWVQGLENAELDTPGQWRVFPDESICHNVADTFLPARQYLGPLDRVDAAMRPADWMTVDYDDCNWSAAITAGPPARSEGWGLPPLRRLVARELPALTEEPRDFVRVWNQLRPENLPWSLPAGESGEIWLDAGALTTSYPQIEFLGGEGREVRLVYAEALGVWRQKDGVAVWEKAGRRDDVNTRTPHGYHDCVILPGGRYAFEPFHWRTFWFLKIEILAGPAAVEVVSAIHRFTTFPHDFSATFSCDHPGLDRLWEISLRTLRLCAHETYEDCPYFEQLNYVADARLQALCIQYLANDVRLARRSLETIRQSFGSDGLVAGRAPSRRRQLIPTFTLHWILMLGDHWQWQGSEETEFVRSCLGAVDSILGYFRNRLTSEGFVGGVDDWSWIDLVAAWPKGMSPAVKAGTGSTYLTAMFACALVQAARLHREAGVPEDAGRWDMLAEQLRDTLRKGAWSEGLGLFIEGPGREADNPTQHTQSMVILAGAADERQQEAVGNRLANDSTLVSSSLFHRFYLARALERTGRYDRFFPMVLAPWRTMLEDGVTTWLESTDPARSDCHGWSSWMIHDFFACILGVRPEAPGWRRIRIEPRFAASGSASGELRVPSGVIRVRWVRRESGEIELRANTPMGVPVTVGLPGGVEKTFREGGAIAVKVNPTIVGVDTAWTPIRCFSFKRG